MSETLSLKVRVLQAGSWSIFIHFVSLIIRLVSSLITTRIFTPDVFGILGIAMVIHVLITILSDIGLQQAVIQSPNGDSRIFLNTAWTLQIIRGCFIWGVCLCVAAGLHIAGMWGDLPADSVY